MVNGAGTRLAETAEILSVELSPTNDEPVAHHRRHLRIIAVMCMDADCTDDSCALVGGKKQRRKDEQRPI